MAIRNIRKDDDEILRKISRVVKTIGDRELELLDDMAQTMYQENGVGLAAVQVGVLRRIIVLDIGDGLMEMINPEIRECSGELIDFEGCLSVTGKIGELARPEKLTVAYQDRTGQNQTLEVEGFLARVICHEVDHLNGILFVDKATRIKDREEPENEDEEDDEEYYQEA